MTLPASSLAAPPTAPLPARPPWARYLRLMRLGLVACLVLVPVSLAVGYLLGTMPLRGHDLRFHVAVTGLLNEALWQDGLWFPLWLGKADFGFGAPVPLFYQPLPHWIAAVLFPDGGDWRLVGLRLGVATLLGLVASFWAAYGWLRVWFPSRSALMGALVYLAVPYHAAIDTVHRQAYAETWGFVAYPLVAWAAERLLRREVRTSWGWGSLALAAAIAFTLVTHVATAILVLPVACGIALLVALVYRRDRVLPLLVGMAGGVALAAWYWVPALLLKDHAPLEAGLYGDIRSWAKPTYYLGGSLLPVQPWDSVGIADLVKVTLVLSLLPVALAFWSLRRAAPDPSRLVLMLWFVAGGVGLFLLSALAYPLWQHLPGLWRVQIPFRVTVLACLAAAPAAAWLWRERQAGLSPMRELAILASLLAPVALSVAILTPRAIAQQVTTTPWEEGAAEVRAITTNWPLRPEYEIAQPTALRARFEAAPQTLAIALTGQADILRASSQPDGGLKLTVDVAAPTSLALRRAAFPGWVMRDTGGQVVPLWAEDGILRVDLGPGIHGLTLDRHWVAPQRWGLALSVAALLLLSVLALWQGRRKAPLDRRE